MLLKNFKAVFSICFMSILLMYTSLVFAQPGMDDFNQGIDAAKAGDYKSALKLFEKAKKAGLDSAALQFNLGVMYYKLGQYENANKEFSGLTQLDNYSQLAYYNLGLVANKQNQNTEAVAAFQKAFEEGKSDKIKILSREALKRLGAEPERPSGTTWAGVLSASYASDSNVTLVNDDLAGVSTKSDNSFILSAFGANWLSGDSSDGLRLFLRGYLQNYSTETDYNYTQIGGGIAKYDRLGSWETRYGGFLDETYLGGSSYQRILTAELRGRKDISKNNQLRLRYRFNSIEATDSLYDYLGGTRHQLRAGMQTRNKGMRLRAYYEYEINDREDYDNPAGTVYTFMSFSPSRHSFRVTGWLDITNLWELRLDARHRTSTYQDDHVLAGGGTELREDTQTRFSARISRELAKDLNAELTYTMIKNDSSLDEESYDRSMASAGLVWEF